MAHVVVNRAKSPKFPRSVCGVVGDGCQFSYRCDGRADALADPRSRARAFKVAETVLAGAPDITEGALFFHSARVAPAGSPPARASAPSAATSSTADPSAVRRR